MTGHSLLSKPTFKEGGEMRAPDGPLGENLHANCFGLHVIPVDERPLIGSTWVDEFSLHMFHSYLRSDMGCFPLLLFFR